MVTGIIGKKVGMTQLFLEDGTLEPATVLQAGPCVVVQCKTAQTDGYDAVQIGLVESKPFRSANKAITGHSQEGQRAADARAARGEGRQGRRGAEARRPGAGARSSTRASAWTSSAPARAMASRASSSAITSAAATRSHGSMFHRAPGSIGASSYPSRVMPGMRMHGHMGVDRVTVRNLKVLKIDAENHLLLVKGAVPGANGGYVRDSQGRGRQARAAAAAAGKAEEGQEVGRR